MKFMQIALAAALVAVGISGGSRFVQGADDKKADAKPKYTIKEVMKKAMGEGLCKKVCSGKGSDEENKKLVELFEALAANKPPKGSAESWKAKTKDLVDAAKAMCAGEDDAGKKLGKAAACKGCHEAHKPAAK